MSQPPSTARLHFKFSGNGDETENAHGSESECSCPEGESCVGADDGSERYEREDAIKLLTEFVESDDINAHANTCKALYDMMPDSGAPESWAEGDLCGLFIEMAEQIPHNHPAQNKLAALMAELSSYDRFNVLEQRRVNLDPKSEGFMRVEYSYYSPFVLFRREFVEMWSRTSPVCYDSRFVNLCAFHARLSTAGLDCSLRFMILSMRTTLEHYTEGYSLAHRSIFVMLAAVWILHGGQLFFHHIVIYPPPMTEGNWRSYRPGDLYNGSIFGLERWAFWQARLAELSDNSDISEEARDLGSRAAYLMAGLARTVE